MNQLKTAAVVALALALAAPVAMAREAGDFIFRSGVTNIDPKQDNSDLVEVNDDSAFTFNGTYMLTSNWGVELLAALPFEHDLVLKTDIGTGSGQSGSTKHLPPTLSFQYHFDTGQAMYPYVGLGLNYTTFFSEETYGPLDGTSLDIDDSFGVALQVGADYMVNDNLLINLDVRWIDIDADATLKAGGSTILDEYEVEIDPWLVGINVGWVF